MSQFSSLSSPLTTGDQGEDKWDMDDMQVSEEKTQMLRTLFNSFDRGGSGRIARGDAVVIMRTLFLHPSEADAADPLEEFPTLSFAEFLEIVRVKAIAQRMDLSGASAEDDVKKQQERFLIAAFAAFDKDGAGYMKFDDLKTALMTYGEPVTAEQLDDIYKTCDTLGFLKEQGLHYPDLARHLVHF